MEEKLVVLLKRKSGLDLEEFRRRYEEEHIPLANRYVGHLLVDVERIWVSDLNPLSTDAVGEPCPYDVVSVYSFKDKEAVKEFWSILSDQDIIAALQAHEDTFLDRVVSREGVCLTSQGLGMFVAASS